MYPAQCEGNNIDNSTMVKAETMLYILDNQDEFGITRIETEQVLDMYSPYEPYKPLGHRHPNKNIICDALKFYQTTDKVRYNLSYRTVPRLPPGKRDPN